MQKLVFCVTMKTLDSCFIFRPIASIDYVELFVHSTSVLNVGPKLEILDVDPQFTPDMGIDIGDNSHHKVILCETLRSCINHVQQCFPGRVNNFKLELGI